MEEASVNADKLIENLKTLGFDYSPHRTQLANDIWWEGMWVGNWDITVVIEGLPSIRCIQEDEYDQHMDEGEDKPTWEDMLFSDPEYTWFN
jgi:hypothetical protein